MQLQPKHGINNKKKIFNDPVYGFISISQEFIFDIIEHPYVQRLRRIKQLGMTHLVYPGALHTRFHHVLGAMHLMSKAIATIRRKGHDISDKEEEAALLAILLHDIGHGPFSHALEHDIVTGVHHEDISIFFMERLSEEFDGRLDLALEIFQNRYPKKYLYQLVSSQLDMDRMDYLNRDSFYTGVSEGKIGSDRIIEMLNVVDGNLVLEEKGIYSIEKFLVARRLMYWQVYLHKTVVAAEFMLIHVLRRAKELTQSGTEVFASPALKYFLVNNVTADDFKQKPEVLDLFAQLDDFDIMGAIKVWQFHEDKVLSTLSRRMIERKLFKIKVSKSEFSEKDKQAVRGKVVEKMGISLEETRYFVYNDILTNSAYNDVSQHINLLMKSGKTMEVSKASDNLNISALADPVEKHFLCYPVFNAGKVRQLSLLNGIK
ncbi:MAG: phosphohydrolase [Fluviicola sp. XM-24bin1]|nr:MAG: phosphohydrolase [Fluviicola sp. XM-24bin1]